jgi:hypothetical protein
MTFVRFEKGNDWHYFVGKDLDEILKDPLVLGSLELSPCVLLSIDEVRTTTQNPIFQHSLNRGIESVEQGLCTSFKIGVLPMKFMN